VNEITEAVGRFTQCKTHQSAISRVIPHLKKEKLIENVRIQGKTKLQLNKIGLYEHLGQMANLLALLIDEESTLYWGKLNTENFSWEARPVRNKRIDFLNNSLPPR